MPIIEVSNPATTTPAFRANPTTAGAGKSASIVRADYDFAVQGGAVGTINLLGSTAIPANSVILDGYLEVLTAVTSGGAGTMSLGVEANGDVVAQAAVSGAPWSTTGRKSIHPAATGAASLKTTVARDVAMVIGTAALTAGKFSVYMKYLIEA